MLKSIRLRPFDDAAADAASTLGVILSHRSEIEGCVAQQWDETPDADGRLVMRWEILPDGTTADIASETPDWEDSTLATCMVGLIRQWTFAPSTEERSPVRFPIRF